MMTKIQELWVRVRAMFRKPSEFERWVNAHNPQSTAELEHLEKEWTHRNHFNQPF
jgi:hypothetical protein